MSTEIDGVNGIIKNTTSDGDITIKGNDGGSEISAVTFDMSAAGTATFNHDVKLGDNSKALFGAGDDLEIYHDGSNSYVKDAGTGNLRLEGTDIRIANSGGTGDYIRCTNGGATDLLHNGSVKISTASGGIDITGGFAATAASTITSSSAGDLLTLKSTDAGAEAGPNLVLFRDSASPANNDVIGRMRFEGEDNEGNKTVYAQLTSQIIDKGSSGGEDSTFQLEVFNNGAIRDIFKVAGATNGLPEIVFNDASQDVNFRIESDGNANMFKLDAGNNAIGIGSDPVSNSMLHIKQASSGQSSVSANAEEFVVEDDDNCGMTILSGTGNTGTISFGDSGDDNIGQVQYHHADNSLKFVVNAGEKLRITSDGFLKAITSGSFVASAQFHEFTNSSGSQQTVFFRHSDANHPYGLQMEFSAAAPDNNTHWFYLASDSSAVRFRVMSDGDVQNHDNAYGSISDERIKQDIRDSNSQWDDIKAVKVRNFKKKDDVRQYGDNAWEQIGVVAQELETVSPKLIRHNNPDASDILSDSSFGTLWTADDVETQDAVLYTSDDQEVIDGNKNVGDIKTPSTKQIGDVKEVKEQVKSVNYSILYMKAIKALQEAQTRIETLETKVAALEG